MRTLLVFAIAATMLSIPAAADDDSLGMPAGQEIDTSFEATQARLDAEGYRDVKMVNGNAYRLAGYDREGSEVLIRINPQSGEIDRTNYVHPMDE